MIQVEIPGSGELALEHLVMDYNGTLAVDGVLLPGVGAILQALAGTLRLHILTAGTFGPVRREALGCECAITAISAGRQDETKAEYVRRIGAGRTAAVGNGRNDRLMLKEAALGIAVIQAEGAAVKTALAAQIVTTDIVSALNLLLHPKRLVATLRK